MNAPSTTTAPPVAPPSAWFADPRLRELTPLTVEPSGRVFGHLASWRECHAESSGLGKRCVRAPRSRTGYARFRLGSVVTAEGTSVATGPIILGTSHAEMAWNASASMHHYSDTGHAVADIAVGEDRFGIWVAGALRPGVSAAQVRVLRASPLSGDWREYAGNLELVACLSVNSPGFAIVRPQPRALVASIGSRGEVGAAVALGVVPQLESVVHSVRLLAMRAEADRMGASTPRRRTPAEFRAMREAIDASRDELSWRELAELDLVAFGDARRVTLAREAHERRLRVTAFARQSASERRRARERSLIASLSAPEAQVQGWEGPLVFEGQATGDGRLIGPGALAPATFPLPLRYAAQDVGGHDGAVIVGRIDSIERRPGGVLWGRGVLDMGSEAGREVARQIAAGFSGGVSVDLDSAEYAEDPATLAPGAPVVTSAARIRAATVVAVPAFADARITLVGPPRPGYPAAYIPINN